MEIGFRKNKERPINIKIVMTQLKFFKQDIVRMLGKNKYRIIYIFMTRSFIGVLLYRVERSLFLLLGRSYSFFRILFLPIIYVLQSYSNIDIHYKSSIEGGLSILHPSVGCVISAKAIIGCGLTLTGGNIIGFNKKKTNTIFQIGNNCTLGANAVIIGPLEIKNNVFIGASACVTQSFDQSNMTLVGVPAKPL